MVIVKKCWRDTPYVFMFCRLCMFIYIDDNQSEIVVKKVFDGFLDPIFFKSKKWNIFDSSGLSDWENHFKKFLLAQSVNAAEFKI